MKLRMDGAPTVLADTRIPSRTERLPPRPLSWKSLADGHYDCAGGDQQAAHDCGGVYFFAQHQDGEHHHQRHAQLVEWRYARGWAQLQRAEIAQPREAGCQA